MCAYYALCKENESVFVGQTIKGCQARANGRTVCFTDKLYSKSTLTYHIFKKDHPINFHDILSRHSLGVIKTSSNVNIDRAKDFYVNLLYADPFLNRYKFVT